jgi:hypothetical protein
VRTAYSSADFLTVYNNVEVVQRGRPGMLPFLPSNARSIASLTISFGRVAIPVKLYSATVSSERISFNLLRQKDGSRVKQQYVPVNDGKLVERSEMTRAMSLRKTSM